MPIAQFKKYPSDVRLKMYKNLNNGRREGMFIFGKIQYIDDDGHPQYLKDHNGRYVLDIRDAVGKFGATDGSKCSIRLKVDLRMVTTTLVGCSLSILSIQILRGPSA